MKIKKETAVDTGLGMTHGRQPARADIACAKF